jgi:hypothetical protein
VRLLSALALAVLALAAGCSGGGSESAAPAGTATTGQDEQFAEDAAVGEALRDFVDAAAAGDVDAMWALLSAGSREQLGPTEAEFSDEFAPGLERGLGSFGGTPYETVLSVTTRSGWGVAAVSGGRIRSGETEFAAYGAALRLEDGAWKVHLGDPIDIVSNEPAETTAERQPTIQFEVGADAPVDEAGLWLDGAALPATAQGTEEAITLVATPEAPLAPGWHVLVVFALAGDEATAGATPFEVEAGEAPTI